MKTFRFALLFVAIFATASAQTSYTITDLGTLPGLVHSYATAINASGQITGYATDANSATAHAFLYSAGRLTDIGTLPGGAISLGYGLNANGQVVGGASTATRDGRGFLYSSGTMTALGTLGGDYSWAYAINGTGQIAGESNRTTNGDFHAFLYASGQMTDLGTLGGANSSAKSINDSGQIAGQSETAGMFSNLHAFLYSTGRMTDLGTLGGSESWANGTNASGQVVGASYLSSTGSPVPIYDQHAFLYANSRMTDLGTIEPYGSSEANAINASGQIVGEVFNLYESNDPDSTGQRAFIYTGGKMTDLNTLLTGARGWTLLQATAINDAGLIAGFGLNPAGERRAFLLTPSSLPPDPVLPVILRAPASQDVAPGATVTFTVAATGAGLSYQWKKNGVAIPGATSETYTIANAAIGQMGFYSVGISRGGDAIESNVAILTVTGASAYTFNTLARGLLGLGSVALDGSGNIYVSNVAKIHKITPQGAVTILPSGGVGTLTFGQGSLEGLAVDSSGNVFVADSYYHVIWKMTPTGVITIFAGQQGTLGNVDGGGGGARFFAPRGVAVDPAGNLYVADSGNNTIRKITPAAVVTTLAGASFAGSVDGLGTAARFRGPTGVAVDANGHVYVADFQNYTIRKITPAGLVTTVAGQAGAYGTADGNSGAARFEAPYAVAVDAPGNVFVADRMANTIREISANGAVTTLAGSANYSGNADGVGASARFYYPQGIAVDRDGNLFVADFSNYSIRKGVPPVAALPVGRLANLSTRGLVPAGGDLTVGFVIRGGSGKSLLVRAVGPTLGNFGITGALADPKLDVIPAGSSLATSSCDDWGGGTTLATAFASVGAFALPTASKDAAVLDTLPIAGYTARITSSVTGGSGIAIAEVYDRDASGAASRLVNVSTLGFVGTGAQALTPGFVIAGTAAKQLLIRAIGPGLAQFGVTGTLADPQLALIPLGQSFTVASNDNWDGTAATSAAFTQAGAFVLPTGSKDAALVVRLPPGGYTVVVSGAGNTTGTALVEIYDLDP